MYTRSEPARARSEVLRQQEKRRCYLNNITEFTARRAKRELADVRHLVFLRTMKLEVVSLADVPVIRSVAGCEHTKPTLYIHKFSIPVLCAKVLSFLLLLLYPTRPFLPPFFFYLFYGACARDPYLSAVAARPRDAPVIYVGFCASLQLYS